MGKITGTRMLCQENFPDFGWGRTGRNPGTGETGIGNRGSSRMGSLGMGEKGRDCRKR